MGYSTIVHFNIKMSSPLDIFHIFNNHKRIHHYNNKINLKYTVTLVLPFVVNSAIFFIILLKKWWTTLQKTIWIKHKSDRPVYLTFKYIQLVIECLEWRTTISGVLGLILTSRHGSYLRSKKPVSRVGRGNTRC